MIKLQKLVEEIVTIYSLKTFRKIALWTPKKLQVWCYGASLYKQDLFLTGDREELFIIPTLYINYINFLAIHFCICIYKTYNI